MALGILVPIVFHAIGLGALFLPMFWPIAIGAFFLPPGLALLVGMLTPLLSTLLTGMPPISPPIVLVMMAELGALALVIAVLRGYCRLPDILVLFIALLGSRIVLFLVLISLIPLLGIPSGALSTALVLRGVPGILVILIVVPILLYALRRVLVSGEWNRST